MGQGRIGQFGDIDLEGHRTIGSDMLISRKLAVLATETLLLLLFACPGWAFDFSGLPVAFLEDFTGETSSPATAEVALLGVSSLIVDGTMSGGAAHFDVDVLGGDGSDIASSFVELRDVVTTGSDIGMRSDFESLSLGSDGVSRTANLTYFEQEGSATPVLLISGGVAITRTGSTYSGLLSVGEADGSSPTSLGTASVVLSVGDAAAIGQGAAYRVDLFVDHSAETATISLEIAGIQVATTPVLALTEYHGGTLSQFISVAAADVGSPAPSTVDLTSLSVYAQTSTFQPFINLDVSDAENVPSTSFGGAGGTGFWNVVSGSPVSLLDVDANASGVTVSLASETITSGAGSPADNVRLLGDYAYSCTGVREWSLALTGLPAGDYRIYTYAPSGVGVETGFIQFDGLSAIGNLPGSVSSTLSEYSSWSLATTTQTDGALTIGASELSGCVGISGIQIELAEPVTSPQVPGLGVPALIVLVGVLGFVSWRRMTPA